MSIITVLLGLVGLLNIAVGCAVLLRDPRKVMNLSFFGITLAVACWVVGIAGFLAVNTSGAAIDWAKFYYLAPLLIAASSTIFADTFPSGGVVSRAKLWFLSLGLLYIAVPLLFLRTFLTESVVYHDWGKQIVLQKVPYAVYSVYLLICFYLAVVKIFKKRKTEKGAYKRQVSVFFIGYIISIVAGVTFDLILPGLGNYRLIWIGTLCTTVYVVATAYSIIKHKLFDIRFFVVRAAAYVFSIALLSVVYIVPSILLVAYVMHIHFTWPRLISGVIAALLFAIFYGSVRERFNRLTNRLFYRGYYEPQEVLNRLSDTLVGTIDANRLRSESGKIITETFRTKKCDYVLVAEHPLIAERILRKLFMVNKSSNTVVLDQIEGVSAVVQELRQQNVAAVIRLRTTHDDLGLVTLGYKESGQLYSDKDKRLLDIMADEIAISLQNALHFQQIQDFNRTLQGRVNEATKELRRTNEKLKALDETKDDFISMASHQLRTPLTSVKGYLSMVLEGDAGKVTPMQRKMLEQAFISSQRMVYLIADLLNVSRLKTGKFVIEPVPTDLATVVQDEVNQLVETAQSREITLSYSKPHDFPLLLLDETKTRQVVMNFIDNAIYYTPAAGHIAVELADKPTTVELRVIDDGIGVPKSERHHLFTKFYRAGNARKARPDGTGLGLFMAKKVITAQGGAVIFESQEGKGSTFGFTFSKSKLLVEPTNSTQGAAAPLAK